MNSRLEIASRIASGFFSGVPISGDDILKLEEDETFTKDARDCCRAVAKLSLMMADELIKENDKQCSEQGSAVHSASAR